MYPPDFGKLMDIMASLTNWIARMDPCPTCGAQPPAACFPDGRVHPQRITEEEETRDHA
jgi:hypothetical protein